MPLEQRGPMKNNHVLEVKRLLAIDYTRCSENMAPPVRYRYNAVVVLVKKNIRANFGDPSPLYRAGQHQQSRRGRPRLANSTLEWMYAFETTQGIRCWLVRSKSPNLQATLLGGLKPKNSDKVEYYHLFADGPTEMNDFINFLKGVGVLQMVAAYSNYVNK
jgi:hypothetical protein